ncbi:MazG family protein [Gryllotalpicola protaetiae]|uniref:Nucleoside triphosphate pyrophosphohydrolase n=1 Tax=Gryllotalpicola protaetiae TaxID=2419771 RepID=A0A387BNL2_9MICO|nr:MazG family protein [Gryllotalpicola protaetiae]AYG02630.1 nucleoside triphosphate pyrophosphohydrolase [Gryllotalpicola protaetiae]
MTASELDAFAAAMSEVLDTCVWSQRETHASLVPYLIEESYELVEAIEAGTRDDLLEELGDVLWQIVFHAEIARRTPSEGFDVQEVAANVRAKMIRRHPHVFAGEVAETPEDVVRLWTAAKKAEKHERKSVLDGIPRSLPALALADKTIGRAASVGVATDAAPASFTSEDELGEQLLAIVAAARAQGLDAERALRARVRALSDAVRAAEF